MTALKKRIVVATVITFAAIAASILIDVGLIATGATLYVLAGALFVTSPAFTEF